MDYKLIIRNVNNILLIITSFEIKNPIIFLLANEAYILDEYKGYPSPYTKCVLVTNPP